MFKLTVLYPKSDGSTFDMEYYRTKHAAIVMRTLKPSRFEIDEGLPGQPYLAMGHLFFDDAAAMQAGLGGPDAGEAMTDVPNFTNTTPSMQISQTVD
jgi:uncharacterized protein (TIGR02118 family)